MLVTAAALACTAGVATAVLRSAGWTVSPAFTRALAFLSAPLALAAALRSVVAIRRGPALRSFAPEDAAACGSAEASHVRAAAQIRGGLGGAGHVRPARLLLAALAWFAAAAVVACVGADGALAAQCDELLEVLTVSVAARLAFPARPFWYLERADGSVLLFPGSLRAQLGLRSAPPR